MPESREEPTAAYQRRSAEPTLLHRVVREQLEPFVQRFGDASWRSALRRARVPSPDRCSRPHVSQAGQRGVPWRCGFHGVSPKHLQRYLDEFSYRFDRRWREGELFGFVLRRVVRGQPLPYRVLVAERAA